MKTFMLFLLVMIASSCAPSLESPRRTLYYGFDFTKYTAEGFLVTPESYNGEYESIGLLKAKIYPAIIKTKDNDSYYKLTRYIPESINASDAVDSLINKAKEMGADALINFSATIHEIDKPVYTYVISASGFAIKRK